jgi:superfamily II DNA or RNA helicase
VTFVLYSELQDILFSSYTLIIADEIQKITPKAFTFFYTNYIGRLVLLTGTVPDNEEKQEMIMKLCKGHAVILTMEDAMINKVVNPFHVTVIEVMPYALEYEWYLKSCKGMMFADKVPKDVRIRKRMREIYNLQAKADVAVWLVKQLEVLKKRVLVYCASKAQANQICDNQYHSGTDESALVKFLANEILSMAVVGMLNDNANLPDLAYGILVQVYGESANLLQKIGRFQRVVDKDIISKLYLLKAMRTQDEVWVYKALKPISENRIKTVTWERLLQMGYRPQQQTI